MPRLTFQAALAPFRARMAAWVAGHPYAMVLDSATASPHTDPGLGCPDRYGCLHWLAGVGTAQCQRATDEAAFRALQQQQASMPLEERGWWLGGIPYEYGALVEPTAPGPAPQMAWPELAFFRAQTVVYAPRNPDLAQHETVGTIIIEGPDPAQTRQQIEQTAPAPVWHPPATPLRWDTNLSPTEYAKRVHDLLALIRTGDLYEANLTQAYWATEGLEALIANPVGAWEALLAQQPVPFAALFRWDDTRWGLGASPERFVQFRDGWLRTQPIKGTLPRLADAAADALQRQQLAQSERFRAENVMIVDLARNDLYRSCTAASVRVPQLFEVQRFRTLHHLVSTIEGQLRPEVSAWDALLAAFPPGSMTGAPKVRAMQRIAQLEGIGRGLYSGALGYLAPDGQLDLSVVIRTAWLDTARPLLTYHVGGAILADSDADDEAREAQLKARTLRRVLGGI